MTKYKVVYEREKCISALQCVSVMPTKWNVGSDGKADLKGGKKKGSDWELEIDDKELAKMKQAAAACPVNVIHIFDEKGKKLI